MINPVIFSFKLFNLPITLRWYGVLVMFGAVVAALIAEREIRRRGENGDTIWDAMVWALPIGIIGARLWYVVNSIIGGSTYYTDNPIKIINIPEGGLHIFGGFLFGVVTLYFYLKNNGLDFWLFLDSIAPAALIGQALARPANFINQELYGQPTKLPWGIAIQADHRLAQYSDLTKFPVETTRFHPTFAYEMILNFLAFLLLWWISRRFAEAIKPGTMVGGWLVSAGLIRTFIEFFRPDQPRIGSSFVTYSMLISFLMAVAGVVLLLVRYGKLHLAFAEGWEEEYQIKKVEKKVRSHAQTAIAEPVVEAVAVEPAPKKRLAAKTEAFAKAKPAKKTVAKKPAAKKKSTTSSKK